MMIKFTCDFCNANLKVPDNKAGTQDVCPACGETIDIPWTVEPRQVATRKYESKKQKRQQKREQRKLKRFWALQLVVKFVYLICFLYAVLITAVLTYYGELYGLLASPFVVLPFVIPVLLWIQVIDCFLSIEENTR